MLRIPQVWHHLFGPGSIPMVNQNSIEYLTVYNMALITEASIEYPRKTSPVQFKEPVWVEPNKESKQCLALLIPADGSTNSLSVLLGCTKPHICPFYLVLLDQTQMTCDPNELKLDQKPFLMIRDIQFEGKHMNLASQVYILASFLSSLSIN